MKRNKRKPREFKKPFIVLNRRKMTGWIVAILFLCAWMFVLGVLVGRDTAPVKFDIQQLLPSLDDSNTEAQVEEQHQPTKGSVAVKDKTKLRFYEHLPEDQKDTSVPDIKPEQAAPPEKEDQSQSKDSKLKRESQIKKTDTEKATSSKTAAKQEDQRKASAAATKQSTGVLYTIQAASVKKANDADRMVAELKQKGYPAYRTIGKVAQKGIWFRVRIGEYNSKAEARQTLNKLKKLGLKPILVQKQ
ncbi:MAG: SPOR domain-containing protein [Desulfobacterales bacterium]|jgi:cell division protein FtsN